MKPSPFPVGALHERSVRALIHQHELVPAQLDTRMQARDQVALDDEVVVLGAADGDAGLLIIELELAVLASQAQAHEAHWT
jgi:hypothetical protein